MRGGERERVSERGVNERGRGVGERVRSGEGERG